MPTYQEILAEATDFIDNNILKFTGKLDPSHEYFKLFEAACAKSSTPETLAFIIAVQNNSRPKELFKKYIQRDAERQINISFPQRNAFTRLMLELLSRKISNETYFQYVVKGGEYTFSGKTKATTLNSLFVDIATLLKHSKATFFKNLEAKYNVQLDDEPKAA